MERRVPWFWLLAIGLLLLAPGFVGRLAIDVLEGVTLLVVLGPLVLAGAGLLAWQLLKRRLRTCEFCGTTSLAVAQCPACGGVWAASETAADPSAPRTVGRPDITVSASEAVIDVQVTEVADRD